MKKRISVLALSALAVMVLFSCAAKKSFVAGNTYKHESDERVTMEFTADGQVLVFWNASVYRSEPMKKQGVTELTEEQKKTMDDKAIDNHNYNTTWNKKQAEKKLQVAHGTYRVNGTMVTVTIGAAHNLSSILAVDKKVFDAGVSFSTGEICSFHTSDSGATLTSSKDGATWKK